MDPQPSTAGADAAPQPGSVPAHPGPPLVIVGASCRAAAASAAAAGWTVYAADLFDDVDLAATAAATRRAARYPRDLVAAATDFPPAPWCYTGAVENHGDVIDRLAAIRPLAGNPSAAVRRVRDPAALAALLRTAGVRVPETRTTPDGVPTDGSFLRKPLLTAGGRGIAAWNASTPPTRERCCWQRLVSGEPLSAVLALAASAGRVFGVTRQLVGAAWCRASSFAYSGSILIPSPTVTAGVRSQLGAIAAALAGDVGLRGIVGVDMILAPDGTLSVLEVNPRPTASAELIERAEGTSFMAAHLAAFGHPAPRRLHAGRPGVWSKAILFAGRATAIDDPLLERLAERVAPWTAADGLPAIADIPRPGQILRPGTPVLTVFARGDAEPASTTELRRRVAAIVELTG